jgi:MFS family permease
MASAAAAAGLFWLSSAGGLALLAAATLYGIGKSFFWGTSLGVASEQFPRGGAVTINVLAGAGMLAAGIVGSVMLGAAQDHATVAAFARHDASQASQFGAQYLTAGKTSVFGRYRALDPAKLAAAAPADRAALAAIVAQSKQAALRDVALLPLVTLLTYLGLIVFFRSRGGYRPVVLTPAGAAAP